MINPPIDFEKLAEAALAQGGRRVGVGETVVLSPSLQFTVLSGLAVVDKDGQLRVATGSVSINRTASPFRTFDDMVPSAGNGHPALSAAMSGLLRTTGEYTNARAAAGAELKAAGDAKLRAKGPAEREAAEAKVQAAWVVYENARKAERLALATEEATS